LIHLSEKNNGDIAFCPFKVLLWGWQYGLSSRVSAYYWDPEFKPQYYQKKKKTKVPLEISPGRQCSQNALDWSLASPYSYCRVLSKAV
jgi:hypothetical protein